MEHEGVKGLLLLNCTGEGFDTQTKDGAEAELLIAKVPLVLKHGGEPRGHGLLVMHLIQMTDHGELDAAPEWLNEVANQAGAVSAEPVDDPNGGVQPRGEALPFERMVEKAVAVVERDVQRCLRAAFLPRKEILRGGPEVRGPEGPGVFGLQPEDSGERVFLQAGCRRHQGIVAAQELMLILQLGKDEVRCELGGAPLGESAKRR